MPPENSNYGWPDLIVPQDMAVTVAPPVEPVSLAEIKAHIVVEHTDDDAYLTSLGVAARVHVEGYLGASLVQQTRRATYSRFPRVFFDLWYGPVQSIMSVQYVALDGSTETVDGATYKLVSDRLYLAYGQSWPDARCEPGAVQVTYVAGYAPDESVSPTSLTNNIPEVIKLGIKQLVAHWYAMREPVITGTTVAQVPMAVQMLLYPERRR